MAKSGWCIVDTKHTTLLESCKWAKCDCKCHTGTVVKPKRKYTKRKGK